MEKVLGIGGFFFRAADPGTLALWYRDHLGIDVVPQAYDAPAWTQQAGTTVFCPFPADSSYFGDDAKGWMLNFRVRDLAAMTAQLRAAGIAVVVDPETYPNGIFARLKDPEGNPIELWEPRGNTEQT
jgi:catechol 2,3-dioxygenase-like lactoylglutathione lyase family enzyme